MILPSNMLIPVLQPESSLLACLSQLSEFLRTCPTSAAHATAVREEDNTLTQGWSGVRLITNSAPSTWITLLVHGSPATTTVHVDQQELSPQDIQVL